MGCPETSFYDEKPVIRSQWLQKFYGKQKATAEYIYSAGYDINQRNGAIAS